MDDKFNLFMDMFFKAIKDKDQEFMKKVYADWFKSSGLSEQVTEDVFFNKMFEDLSSFDGYSLDACEEYDGGLVVAHLKKAGGPEINLVFESKGDGWIFYNEMSNMASFGLVYTLQYINHSSGPIRLLLNGKRSPLIQDIDPGASGFITPLNFALKSGSNELTIQLLEGDSGEVEIRINGTPQGDIANSAEGNILSWKGNVSKKMDLKFEVS